jgi:glycosyltransferase involved in cell wall biosynthesis
MRDVSLEATTGVSVVICCYNGAKRLPQTLAHLANQQVRDRLRWEVIVVDNASTDETSQVALGSWPVDAPVPLRVVYEHRRGKACARDRGFSEAKYEIVSFLDDDNWVCPEWVQSVSDIMVQHPDIGACGGYSDAICEVSPPRWFEGHKRSYAIGPWGNEEGYVPRTQGAFWGAGCTIRKSAWQQIVNNGFRPLLVGRQGSRLAAGEDSELCFALVLTGWRLWYEPSLRFQHFLPASRLNWKHLRRLHRGFGAASVMLDPYLFALKQNPKTLKEIWKRTWTFRISVTLVSLLYYSIKLPINRAMYHQTLEGNSVVLSLEYVCARLSELLRNRKKYNFSINEIQNASWIKCLKISNQ